MIIFWCSLVSVIHGYLDFGEVDDLGFLYLVIGCPLLTTVYLQLLERRGERIIQLSIRQIRGESDLEMLVHTLIDLIENREDVRKRMILEGFVKFHIRDCMKSMDNCVCQQLHLDNMREEESPNKHRRWYMLIQSILTECLEKFQKSARLHLLNAYLNQDRLQNKFKALFELMLTEELKPNSQEEFSIFRYKYTIEEEMKENDIRTSETKGIDVNVIVHFQNRFVNFQIAVERSVNLHLEYWRELLEESPDISKLQQLGSKITIALEECQELFKKLQLINSNHIGCLEIYGVFLRDIVNDDIECVRILDKAEYVQKSQKLNRQFIDNDRQKYGENSNTCIVTCSGNYNNMGIVTNCNNEIYRILGFKKMDVIHQNVNRIMPKVYAEQHEIFMKKYLATSQSKIIGQERLILAQNRQGYLVPCSLMIKVLPTLEEGIQIVGFLKDIEEAYTDPSTGEEIKSNFHYIIYNANTFVIMGITSNCYELFGIPAALVYGNSGNTTEFTIDTIAPEIVQQANQEALKISGIICTLDTTQIQSNYLIGHNDSDDEDQQDFNQLQNNYYDQANQSNVIGLSHYNKPDNNNNGLLDSSLVNQSINNNHNNNNQQQQADDWQSVDANPVVEEGTESGEVQANDDKVPADRGLRSGRLPDPRDQVHGVGRQRAELETAE